MGVTVTNRNYCAIVVRADTFVDLPNCDNVKGCLIFGNHIIVGKGMEPGTIGLYFPVETQITQQFLGQNNLFRKAEYGNIDPASKGGFFEANGRVRCMRFRGHKSEGFFMPLDGILGIPKEELVLGIEFNSIDGIEVCKKYVPRIRGMNSNGGQGKPKGRQPKKKDLILDGQFRFHYETAQLKRNLHKLEQDTPIIITDKWHGTSVVMGHLLTMRTLKWYERLLLKLGVQIQQTEYGVVAASRRVIKSVAGEETEDKNHYYDSDLWSLVTKENASRIPRGFTVYGEIVGYTPGGSWIQKGYSYRCAPGTHQLVVYRVTFTNQDGHVYELTWEQVKEFCTQYGFEHVVELWKGNPFLMMEDDGYPKEKDWRDKFLEKLQKYFLERRCPYNDGVPSEGIVIRVDHLQESEAYKLKSFAFLERETNMLDEGSEDLETIEEALVTEETCNE